MNIRYGQGLDNPPNESILIDRAEMYYNAQFMARKADKMREAVALSELAIERMHAGDYQQAMLMIADAVAKWPQSASLKVLHNHIETLYKGAL